MQVHAGLLAYGAIMVPMTIIGIRAITVPEKGGEERARGHARGASDADAFQGFELLRPTDGRTTSLVLTCRHDQEAFEVLSGGRPRPSRGVGRGR